jgi:predicted negative regulator of RcsB-dependent stress response
LISWQGQHKEQQVSQEEELEKFKRFWQDHGMSLLVGALLAVAVFFGLQAWQKSRLDQAARASTLFQEMLGAVQRSQLNPADKAANTEVQRLGKTLKDDFESTPYAVSAALLLARQAADRNEYKDAEKQLRWVLEQKPEDAERVLTTTRLARVLAAQKQYDAALALLQKEEAPGFTPTVEELKGDIYVALGKIDEARKAYEAAARALLERKERRPLLEMKMADVGLAPLEPKKEDAKDKKDEQSEEESSSS